MSIAKGLVLAAGLGTRMKSHLPKVLHKVAGKPMVSLVVESLIAASVSEIGVVVGYKKELVKQALNSYEVSFITQEQPLGTGHAIQVSKEFIKQNDKLLIVIPGDVPLVDADLIRSLIMRHTEQDAALTVITMEVEDPTGYGRIISENGKILAIREHKDATPAELEITVVNSGIYAFDTKYLLETIDTINASNAKKEFYLTDVIGILSERNETVAELRLLKNDKRSRGVNDVEQLRELDKIFCETRNKTG